MSQNPLGFLSKIAGTRIAADKLTKIKEEVNKMFSTKKYRLLTAGVARFLVGVAALVALAPPALAQSTFTGTYCTFTQGGWGSAPSGSNPGMILANNFPAVFPFGVKVGSPLGYSMTFTSAAAVEAYLPAGGKANVLTNSSTNPLSSSSGVFGGQVLALQLNVDFNDAGKIGDGLSPTFGDLVFYATNTSFDGMAVRQVLAAANQALGEGLLPHDYSIRGEVSGTANLNDLVSFLNQGFNNCIPSDWVKEHLMESSGDIVLVQ